MLVTKMLDATLTIGVAGEVKATNKCNNSQTPMSIKTNPVSLVVCNVTTRLSQGEGIGRCRL